MAIASRDFAGDANEVDSVNGAGRESTDEVMEDGMSLKTLNIVYTAELLLLAMGLSIASCRKPEPEQPSIPSREYTDESPKDQLEAALSILWRDFRHWWLVSDNELQFRNQIHNQASVLVQGITEVAAPFAKLCLGLR